MPVTINGTTGITTPAESVTGTSTGSLTTSGNASINGVTVGLGAGNISSNVSVGNGALNANTTGNNNTAIGYQALNVNTTGVQNTALGYQALLSHTGNNTLALGFQSLYLNTTGTNNTAVGTYVLSANVTGSNLTAIGFGALNASTSSNNTAVGYQSLFSNTSSSSNTAIGYQAGYSNTTASSSAGHVFIGHRAGFSSTGTDNTYIGAQAAENATTGGGNVAIGWWAGSSNGASIFNIAGNSDRIVIGSNNTTNAYVKVAWTVTSDARDKTDVADVTYGLSFVNQLRPITFVWDERSNYKDGIPDGSKKKTKRQIGFLAQDVIALEKSLGATDKNLLIADDEEDERLKITESKIIPALVKAIQELSAKLDAAEARIAALEAK